MVIKTAAALYKIEYNIGEYLAKNKFTVKQSIHALQNKLRPILTIPSAGVYLEIYRLTTIADSSIYGDYRVNIGDEMCKVLTRVLLRATSQDYYKKAYED